MKKKPVRDLIIDTAVHLFYRQGYGNTGINQIIKEAGVSKASLYKHFNSKGHLLKIYLQVTGGHTMEMLTAAAARELTVKAKIVAIFCQLEVSMRTDKSSDCHFLDLLMELSQNDEEITGLIRQQKDTLRNFFADMLASEGKEHLADQLYVLLEGALIARKLHGGAWPLAKARTIICRILENSD